MGPAGTPLNLSVNPSASAAGHVASEIGSPMYFGSQQSNNRVLPVVLLGGLALWLIMRK